MADTPRLPVVGEFVRHVGTLVKIEEIPPPPQPPPQVDYIFETIEARGELRRRGVVIQEFDACTDFYGLGSSVTGRIKDMQEYAARNAITADSEVEVVVVKVVSYHRSRPKPADNENFYDKTFRDFETLPVGCHRAVPDDVETVVWSTKNLEVTGG